MLNKKTTTAAALAVLLTIQPVHAFSDFPILDARVTIAGYQFGLVDMYPGSRNPPELQQPFTLLEVGPIGFFNMPFDISGAAYAGRCAAVGLVRF